MTATLSGALPLSNLEVKRLPGIGITARRDPPGRD